MNEAGTVIARLWWLRLPLHAYARSPALGSALTDGIHWLQWPAAAAAGPIVALGAGAVAAALQPGHTWTTSLLTICLIIAPAVLATTLGACALVGYVVVDALNNPWVLSRSASAAERWVGAPAGQLVEYLLLAIAAVAIPVAVLAIRVEIRALGRRLALSDWLERGLAVAAWTMLAYFWVASLPILIRPPFSFQGRAPTAAAVVPIQRRGWIVLVVVAGVTVLRMVLERRAVGERVLRAIDTIATTAPVRTGGRSWLPAPATRLLVASATTLLLGGLITHVVGGAIVFAVVFATILARDHIRDRARWRSLAAIPLLGRYLAGIGLTYLAVRLALRFASTSTVLGTSLRSESFVWPLVGAVASIVTVTLLTAPVRTHAPRPDPDVS